MKNNYYLSQIVKGTLISALVVSMCIFSVGCSDTSAKTDDPEPETSSEDYTQYVQVGDYKSVTTDITLKEITDEDIEDLYEQVMSEYPYIVSDSEGIVDEGDIVSLSYKITGEDHERTLEGAVGTDVIPSDISEAILTHKIGDTVVTEGEGGSVGYTINILSIQTQGEITDEYVESLDIDGAKTISQLKRNVKLYLKDKYYTEYKESVEEDLISKIYESSTFKDMPDEYVQVFKDIVQNRLDNVIYAYSLEGEEKTYNDVLEETFEKDNIDTVEEYVDAYGLQNARIYAICETIAKNEGIEADITDIYSLAATDWQNVSEAYETLSDFLKDNDIEVYRKAVLMNTVKDYLFTNVTGSTVEEGATETENAISSSEAGADLSDETDSSSSEGSSENDG